MKENAIVKLLESGQTVFTTQNLAVLWGILDTKYLKTKVYRLVKMGRLTRIKPGLFVLYDKYNKYELANKLITPSYISLSTVLAQKGVIYQYDSAVYSICSNRSTKYIVDEQNFVYKKIKDNIFYIKEGVESVNGVMIASLERAIVDTLYLEKDCYFDNPKSIDWERCFELAFLYEDKTLLKRLKKLYEIYNGSKKT